MMLIFFIEHLEKISQILDTWCSILDTRFGTEKLSIKDPVYHPGGDGLKYFYFIRIQSLDLLI